MKIIVTGGAGFIGSHITDMLIKKGHGVCVIDNLVHGRVENLNSGAEFIKMDIRDRGIGDVFISEKPDILIHEAAQISVSHSIENPVYDADVNIIGTLNLLESARKSGVKKIIYPASAAIFGEPEYLPVDEAHSLNMLSDYGVTKHTVEHYLKVYSNLYGIKYTIFRYSNVYGPRQDSTGEGGVVAIFCESLIKGRQPVIFGDGEQTRDFVYVKDIARVNLLALEGGDNEIFNVCTNSAVSVNKLLSVMNMVRGTCFKAIHKPSREGDIKNSFMTYKKIKEALGWTPNYSLEEGLKETFEYYEGCRF